MNYLKILLLLALFSMTLQARIWRVDNISRHNADFATLQSAHDGAAVGDTLYIAGTGNNFGNCVFTKRLSVIGAGYFLTENPITQATSFTSRVSTLTFNNGSDGSIVMGVSILNIVINTDFINILRVKSDNSGSLFISVYGSYNVIKQSYITGNTTIQLNPGSGNNIISNNYLSGYINAASSFGNLITNNITLGNFQTSASIIKNNILISGSWSGTGDILANNISDGIDFGTDNGNQENVDMSTVFLGYPDQGSFSTDGRWQLTGGSPAIGAGENGVDCGMFGGSDPYVLSGLPNIPAIYSFTSPDSTDGNPTIPVQIQGKVHR